MKRTTILFLTLLTIVLSVRGQIAVESFRLLETDLTAITNGTQETDQNGEVAALIKVVTTHRDFVFDGGMLGIVKVIVKPSEYWVYVPRKLMKISISHPYLGMLRDYYFPLPIEGARTYELVLRVGQPATVLSNSSKKREITLCVTPPNATLFIDSEEKSLNEKGEFTGNLPVGNHTYYAEAADYESDSGMLEVKDEANEPFLIQLKLLPPIYGFLRVETEPIGAIVYVDDKVVGETPCDLDTLSRITIGDHEIRITKEGYDTYTTTARFDQVSGTILSGIRLTQSFEGSILSHPKARLMFDDMDVGRTPYSARFVVGTHHLRLEHKGYEVFDEKVRLSSEMPNPIFRLTRKPLSQTMYYIGAEAHVGGILAADAVAGFYISGFNGEFRVRYPLSASATAYYNIRSSDDMASEPHALTVSSGFSLQGLWGYGIRVGKLFRMTPAVGIRATTLKGVTEDGSISDQRTYVLSGVATIKAEYALTPFVSIVTAPEFALPFSKNEFISTVEGVLTEIKGWYGGVGVNAGIHFNF